MKVKVMLQSGKHSQHLNLFGLTLSKRLNKARVKKKKHQTALPQNNSLNDQVPCQDH